MNDSRPARNLFWIVLLKVAVLFALWWGFFRGQTVTVDPAAIVGAGLAIEDAVFDQLGETVGQDIPRDAELGQLRGRPRVVGRLQLVCVRRWCEA